MSATSLERSWILILAALLLLGALITMFTIGGFGALTGFASGIVLAAAAIGLVIVLGFVVLGVQRTVVDKRVRYLALGVAAGVFFFSNQITSHFHFAVYPMTLAGTSEGASAPIFVLVLVVLLIVIGSKIEWKKLL